MRRKIVSLIFLFSISILIQSCMILNPVKRQPLAVSKYENGIALQDKTIKVHFIPVIEGKPVNETVWDNMQGPIWDVNESHQIGFTQDYQFTPVILPGVATVATTNRGTRIVIPFGNTLVTMFNSALNQAYKKSSVCLEEKCTNGNDADFDKTLSIKVKEFRVFESPLNHINFLLKVNSQIQTRGGNPVSKESTYSLNAFKLGSIASTSYGFIEKMNDALNQFTEKIVSDLLSNVNEIDKR